MDSDAMFRCIRCPWVILGLLVVTGLLFGWVSSMRQIDLLTWTIGPVSGGERIIQLSQCNGTIGLFVGGSGLSRGAGIHYDSRVLSSDEGGNSWFPRWAVVGSEQTGLSLQVAHWVLAAISILVMIAAFLRCRKKRGISFTRNLPCQFAKSRAA